MVFSHMVVCVCLAKVQSAGFFSYIDWLNYSFAMLRSPDG